MAKKSKYRKVPRKAEQELLKYLRNRKATGESSGLLDHQRIESIQNIQDMAKKINSFTLVFSKDKGEIYALTEFFTDNFRGILLVSQKEVNNSESLEGK